MEIEQGVAPLRTKIKSGMCHSAFLVVRLTRAKRLCAQSVATASNARVTFGRLSTAVSTTPEQYRNQLRSSTRFRSNSRLGRSICGYRCCYPANGATNNRDRYHCLYLLLDILSSLYFPYVFRFPSSCLLPHNSARIRYRLFLYAK